MPFKPKHPCSYSGCPALTDKRFCPQHTRQAAADDRARRGSSSERGYDGRWQEYRTVFLGKYPLCGDRPLDHPQLGDALRRQAQAAGYLNLIRPAVEFSPCKAAGRVVPAVIVDHILPVSGPSDPKFLPEWNHQALCIPCHNLKTARERCQAS
mgnify:CR=1 FL=1